MTLPLQRAAARLTGGARTADPSPSPSPSSGAAEQPPVGGARPAPAPAPSRADRRALAGLCALVFAVYATYAWLRHVHYETTNYDLGIFDQAVRAYSHFEAPIVPLKAPGYDLLGDHFHPLIAVLAPLYWVWDDPRVLLLAQAALFAASMVPVARFTELRLGGRRALVVALVYGLSWPLQRAVHFDFHEIAFAVPLIAVVIDAIDRRAWRWVVVCCVLLLGVREDMGAFVVLAGVLVALRSPAPAADRAAIGSRPLPADHAIPVDHEDRADQSNRPAEAERADQADRDDRGHGRAGRVRRWAAPRRVGLAVGGLLVLVGVLGYGLATSVVIPALAPGGTFAYWTFPALGPDPASAVRFALTQPWRVLQLLVTPSVKAHTLLALVFPTAFLAVLSPYVVLTLPFIAERMLNSRTQLWETGYHYSSVLAPTLAMAAVDTAAKAAGWLRARRPGWRWRGLRPVDLWIAWSVGYLVVGLVLRWPDYPMVRLQNSAFWRDHARDAAIERVLPRIPADQCVEAANQLGPHLTMRDYVTQPTQSGGRATWVVLDMSQVDTGWQTPPPNAALAQSVQAGYDIVDIDYPIVLMHRDGPVLPVCRTH